MLRAALLRWVRSVPVKVDEMSGAYATRGGEEKRVKNVVGKPEGKRRFEKPRHRREEDIKMDLKGRGWKDM